MAPCEQRSLYYPERSRRRSAQRHARPCRTRDRSCSLASCCVLLVLIMATSAAVSTLKAGENSTIQNVTQSAHNPQAPSNTAKECYDSLHQEGPIEKSDRMVIRGAGSRPHLR